MTGNSFWTNWKQFLKNMFQDVSSKKQSQLQLFGGKFVGKHKHVFSSLVFLFVSICENKKEGVWKIFLTLFFGMKLWKFDGKGSNQVEQGSCPHSFCTSKVVFWKQSLFSFFFFWIRFDFLFIQPFGVSELCLWDIISGAKRSVVHAPFVCHQ